MVDRAIKVAILARRFCSHVWLRFPLALSFQLQKNALKLSEALWTAKSSGSGFSVSLFWPSSTASNLKSQKYSKRRCRRKPKATIKVDVATSTTTPVHLSLFNANLESLSPNTVDINSKLTTPGTSAASLPVTNELPVHSPSSKNQSACSDSCDDRDTVTEPEVDLLSCTEVAYEKRDGTREYPTVIPLASINGHLWSAREEDSFARLRVATVPSPPPPRTAHNRLRFWVFWFWSAILDIPEKA